MAPEIGATPLLCRLIEAAAVAAAVAAAAADPAVAVIPIHESTFVSVKCSINSLPGKNSHLSPEEEGAGEGNSAKIGASGSNWRRHKESSSSTICLSC